MIKGISMVLVVFCLMSLFACKPAEPIVKNVILLIGDGMGENQVNLARLSNGAELHMDSIETRITVGTDNFTGGTTDSAAAATAIACGKKTFNGYLGKDADENDLESLIDVSQKLNKKTGLVTTVTVSHATPAGFASHTTNRNDEIAIAAQMMERNIDVLMGGGINNFELIHKNDMTLLDVAKEEKGYSVATNLDEMNTTQGDKVLGLFNDFGVLPYESKRDKETIPSLSQMTQKAIDVLSKSEDGFFMMVEGGKIDTAGHSNLIDENIGETLAFDQAVKVALDFAQKDKNTLVIVTADHETGGLTADNLDDINTYKFTTGSHTKARVPLYAFGAGSKRFDHDIENNEIFTIIKAAMENVDPTETTKAA